LDYSASRVSKSFNPVDSLTIGNPKSELQSDIERFCKEISHAAQGRPNEKNSAGKNSTYSSHFH